MDSLQSVFDLLHSLYGLPGYALVFLLAIGFGYLCKVSKFVPNDKIPLLNFIWGMIWNLMLAETKAPDASLRLWIGRNLAIGFVIVLIAWLFHNKILKRYFDPWYFPTKQTKTTKNNNENNQMARHVHHRCAGPRRPCR